MAGINQHYSPQSLLRRFGQRPRKGKQTRVAVYERGNIFVTGTTGAAAQRYFYSRPSEDGSRTLDDEITRYEPRISAILNAIDSYPSGSVIGAQEPAELVSHLCMRNSQARESFTHAVDRIFEGATGMLNDPATRWRMMGLDKAYPSGPILEEANRLYNEHALAMQGVNRAQFAQWLFEFAKIKFHPNNGPGPLEIEPFLQAMKGALPDIAANAQRRAIGRDMAAEGRSVALRELTWTVRDTDFDLILPDCIAVEGQSPDDCRALVYRPNAELRCVVMPVSIRRYTVGTRQDGSCLTEQSINRQLASCCWRFFVTRERSPALEPLLEYVSTATREWLDAETGLAIASQKEAL